PRQTLVQRWPERHSLLPRIVRNSAVGGRQAKPLIQRGDFAEHALLLAPAALDPFIVVAPRLARLVALAQPAVEAAELRFEGGGVDLLHGKTGRLRVRAEEIQQSL